MQHLKKGPPDSEKDKEKLRIFDFEGLKEASWCTDFIAKNKNSFWLTILEKICVDRPKYQQKLDFLSLLFLIFP